MSIISAIGLFDAHYPQEQKVKDPVGSEKTQERIQELGLKNFNQIGSASKALDTLQKLTVKASVGLKAPLFSSDKKTALKAVDFLELFCLYATQSKVLRVQPQVEIVFAEMVEKKKKSLEHEIKNNEKLLLWAKDKELNLYHKMAHCSTTCKVIEELESIKEHIEAGTGKEAIKLISARLNKHVDKLFTHCLGIVDQEYFVKMLNEAKEVIDKY